MEKAKLFDVCRVYGAVYFVDRRSEAHFSVYFQQDEGVDDLTVFYQDIQAYADRPGMWFVTEEKGFADFYIFKETHYGHQDFSVFVTDVESFAGCH